VSAWTGHEERVRLHRAFIDAAVRAEVGHLVYLSFMGAQPQAAFAHARSHAETEADLHACGLPVTILRTSYYGFNLAAFFVDGVVRGPGGAVSWVDRDDCAEALAAALRGAGDPAGATYELTGPAAPTLAQSAARVGELLGTDYAWVEEDAPGPEGTEFQRGIRARGSRAIALGEMAAMGDGVRRLCGREATPVDAYVLANPSEFLP
jgi:uncharacterized protein YbjT (DUF2867 family)